MIDDLRPCLAHRLPINRCASCWPLFLKHLGALCAKDEPRMLAVLGGAQYVGFLKKKVTGSQRPTL